MTVDGLVFAAYRLSSHSLYSKATDLVISVDTAVAHLAGALGIPTWLLLPANADFRWLRSKSDSPWYPGVIRIFRQPSPGDWQSVITEVHDSLDKLFLLDLQHLAASCKGQ